MPTCFIVTTMCAVVNIMIKIKENSCLRQLSVGRCIVVGNEIKEKIKAIGHMVLNAMTSTRIFYRSKNFLNDEELLCKTIILSILGIK